MMLKCSFKAATQYPEMGNKWESTSANSQMTKMQMTLLFLALLDKCLHELKLFICRHWIEVVKYDIYDASDL